MTARDYLAFLEELRREIVRKEERAEALRRMAVSLAPKIIGDVRVRTSPSPDRTQILIGEAVDEEKEAACLRDQYAEMLTAFSLAISALPDPLMVRILELRYLENRPWRSIACATHHSERRVFALHSGALSLLPEFPDPVIQSP